MRFKKNDYLFYNFIFNDNEYKRTKYFSQKIRNLIINSNSFNQKTIETISAHSFRVFHAVEMFENKSIKIAEEELGHKNKVTIYNSNVKPEIRNLNIREEKQSLLINKGNIITKQKSKNKDIIIKNNVNNICDEKNKKYDESSIDSDDDGSDIIDDDFNVKENIFFLKIIFMKILILLRIRIYFQKMKLMKIKVLFWVLKKNMNKNH